MSDDTSREQPLMQHLIALRGCVISCLLAWFSCCVAAGCASPVVLSWLKRPMKALEEAGKLRVEGLDLLSGMDVLFSIALWGGLLLSFPLLAYYILKFVFPALTKKEKISILAYLAGGTVSFVIGFGVAYSQMLPVAVEFFVAVNDWMGLTVEIIRIDGYISLILKAMLGLGLVFQLPLLLFVLGCLGVVESSSLRRWRRFAIVVAFFLGMVLTPPDPMSQIIMALPLCILYELCIWGVWLKEKLSSAGQSES